MSKRVGVDGGRRLRYMHSAGLSMSLLAVVTSLSHLDCAKKREWAPRSGAPVGFAANARYQSLFCGKVQFNHGRNEVCTVDTAT